MSICVVQVHLAGVCLLLLRHGVDVDGAAGQRSCSSRTERLSQPKYQWWSGTQQHFHLRELCRWMSRPHQSRLY